MDALFINVGDSYQETARLDSSWGPTPQAIDDTGPVGLHSVGRRHLQQVDMLHGCLPSAGH